MSSRPEVRTRPSFMEGVGVALFASIAISVSVYLFDWLLPFGLLVRALISLVGFVYLLYLFSRCPEKTGRITAITIYVLMTVATWIFMPGLLWVVTVNLALIWLIRSLYFYSSVLSALLDLGLMALSVIAAVSAYLHTSSLFLALWCLFFMQAWFSWIPSDWQYRSLDHRRSKQTDRFNTAYQAAEQAARQLALNSGSK